LVNKVAIFIKSLFLYCFYHNKYLFLHS